MSSCRRGSHIDHHCAVVEGALPQLITVGFEDGLHNGIGERVDVADHIDEGFLCERWIIGGGGVVDEFASSALDEAKQTQNRELAL